MADDFKARQQLEQRPCASEQCKGAAHPHWVTFATEGTGWAEISTCMACRKETIKAGRLAPAKD